MLDPGRIEAGMGSKKRTEGIASGIDRVDYFYIAVKFLFTQYNHAESRMKGRQSIKEGIDQGSQSIISRSGRLTTIEDARLEIGSC